MCGIAGIARLSGPITADDSAVVRRMVALQKHRGPDDSGIYEHGSVVLGHGMLAIIDLSPAGHQPMTNEDGTVRVSFNGEIYNWVELARDLQRLGHCFRSRCDTEVLIHGYEEWGIDGLLGRLDGMFAFALFDSRPGANGAHPW